MTLRTTDSSVYLKEHTKLEADWQHWHTKWSKLQTTLDRWEHQSNRYPLDASRKEKLQQLKEQCSEAHAQLNAAFNRRLEYGSSSLAPILNAVEKEEIKGVELQKLVTELTSKLTEAESLKKEVETKPADLNMEPPSTSLKRRRLSTGYEDTSSAAVLKQEMITIDATLKAISERVSYTENSIHAQEAETQEIMLAYIHDHAASGANPSSKHNDIDEEVNHIGDELEDVSEWISDLAKDNAKLEEEREHLVDDQEKHAREIRNLLVRVEKHENDHIKDKNEIEALSAALTAYREKPVSPPSSPFDPEAVMVDMEAQIKQLVRNAIKPHIEETRIALSDDLQKYDSELYSSFWSKLSLTNKVISAVSQVTKQSPAA